jgi:hypothetical protein
VLLAISMWWLLQEPASGSGRNAGLQQQQWQQQEVWHHPMLLSAVLSQLQRRQVQVRLLCRSAVRCARLCGSPWQTLHQLQQRKQQRQWLHPRQQQTLQLQQHRNQQQQGQRQL